MTHHQKGVFGFLCGIAAGYAAVVYSQKPKPATPKDSAAKQV